MPPASKDALRRQILATISHHQMIYGGETIGLAVSGGADSVALLRLFLELRGQLGISICVLHLNHNLRGKHSEADEKFVAKQAKKFGLAFFASSQDCAAEAKRNHWNLEDAGRRARYSFFNSLISQQKCTKVATAHTADDQAETVLARLLRGSGVRGLAGIHALKDGIIRPIIDVRRADLRKYLRNLKQNWREDASNLDETRLRARLRHSLIPLLQREYNPKIVEALHTLAGQSHDEEALWDALTQQSLQNSAHYTGSILSVSLKGLLSPSALQFGNPDRTAQEVAASEALTKRMILALLTKLHGASTDKQPVTPSARFESKHIDQILRLAKTSQSGRQVELPNGIRVSRNFDRLEFAQMETHAHARPGHRSKPAGTSSLRPASYTYEYRVELRPDSSATIDVPEMHTRFRLKLIDWPGGERETNRCDVLDADRLSHPLVLRNWRPGDIYRLPGQGHTQKLKKYFASRRISLRDRPGWPVLISGSDIAWTRGFVAASFRVTKASKRGLTVSEEKNGSNPPEILEGEAHHPRSSARASDLQRLRRSQSRRSRSR